MRERDLFSVLRRAGCIPRNCAGMSRARCISNVGLLGRAFNRNGRDNPRAKGGSAAGGGGEGGRERGEAYRGFRRNRAILRFIGTRRRARIFLGPIRDSAPRPRRFAS